MATLAAAIETKLRAVIAAEELIDLSRQRESKPDPPSGETENTARTTAVAELAAGEVQGYLGDVDGGDAQAVALGVKAALVTYTTIYPAVLTEAGLAFTRDVDRKLERLAQARRDGLTGASEAEPTATGDLLDKRFPATNRSTDTDDSVL